VAGCNRIRTTAPWNGATEVAPAHPTISGKPRFVGAASGAPRVRRGSNPGETDLAASHGKPAAVAGVCQGRVYMYIIIDSWNYYVHGIFMNFEWDTDKRISNLKKHRTDLAAIEFFAWDIAFTREDARKDYGETRFVSISLIGDRHYVAVWSQRGETMRIISLRKANEREVKKYATR